MKDTQYISKQISKIPKLLFCSTHLCVVETRTGTVVFTRNDVGLGVRSLLMLTITCKIKRHIHIKIKNTYVVSGCITENYFINMAFNVWSMHLRTSSRKSHCDKTVILIVLLKVIH